MVLLAVTVASILLIRPVSRLRITREDFCRIRRGMSYPEVEAIMGCPPVDCSTGETDFDRTAFEQLLREDLVDEDDSPAPGTHLAYAISWVTDTANFGVMFDASGKVIYRIYTPIRKVTDEPLANLLWRAKRQWRRWFPE
jgi:hypothetical protein